MKNPIRALFVLCVLFTCPLSQSADWPQYRGVRGDGVSQEVITNTNWTKSAPKILWKVPTPLGFSSPSVADGRVFTIVARGEGDDKVESCLALDANTGKELWHTDFGVSDYGHSGGNAGASDNRDGDGPRSTPSTDGQRVFVYDSHMLLTCLNATDGSVVWQHDVLKEFAGRQIKWLNATSPLLIDNVVYIGGGGAGASFLAFDAATGKLKWKSGDETITHATPRFAQIADADQVVFLAKSGLVSVDPVNGGEIWRTDFPFSVSTAASPVVDKNLVYCSAGYSVGAKLVGISDKQEASELWVQKNRLMNHWSTPVVRDGHLYGIYEFKKYGKAPLNCVEIATGEIKWSERGFGPGNCVLVGDKLIVLSDAGEVVLTDASPDGYRELGRIKAIDGKCWSTPAFSNGRIYVRSTKEAACIVVD